jgi:hypothetical protein
MIWSNGRVLRRPAVLLAVTALLWLGSPASPLSPVVPPAGAACPRPAPGAAVQRAAAAFTGTVTAATASADGFVQTVRLDRVYKGDVTGTEVRVRTTAGPCGLGQLRTGQRYVVLAAAAGDSWLAGPRSGTAPAASALLTRVQQLLGAGTAPTAGPSAPQQVTFDTVGDTHPRPFLRVAAPGFALVLLGLLGLVVSRRFRTAS